MNWKLTTGTALTALLVAAGAALGVSMTRTATATATPPPDHVSNQIVTATHTGDIHVTGVLGGPIQTVLTANATYDGSPVRVTFDLEYVNEIPDPNSVSNGIGFDLYEDGTYLERLALFGAHQASVPMFAPINAATILDGSVTPTAGTHVFSIVVWKWSPGADGYLRAGDSSGIIAQPARLTINYA